MSNFESLHPAIKYHIVNSLGWKELRPFQDEAITHVLSGNHAIIIAPTAGGKTESAVLPILSQILEKPWNGLSVLYICPMKALINDLGVRLDRYFTLVGRRAAVWHGDIGRGPRDRILQDPPDLLLTTPESLEAILVSTRSNEKVFFANLKAVIIDEIHLFAGDDRGWHLLALLSRLKRIAGHEFQRIGLSATVGNPDSLAKWLTCGCVLDTRVLAPEEIQTVDSDIQIDYVGSLENAATVISRMHRGEKRLVFVDSRARAEQLANALHRLDVRTFITHSSLSKDERSRAESAFQTEENCVIVATSVLEVGVDVGDLDRVIQIDAPRTVSSFLQRMGRTGRRRGTTRNCLFLATRDDSLIRAAAIVRLFEKGYVEPIQPPSEPFHILAQQILAICLQESGIGVRNWFDWIRDVPAFSAMDESEIRSIVTWMLNNEVLFEEQGILSIGGKGEDLYGRRNYLEILSVFLSPPFFIILCGIEEIGYMDERSFMHRDRGDTRIILLGGRAWAVKHIDWRRHRAYVEPIEAEGGARWMGDSSGLSFAVCQAMKETLIFRDNYRCFSERAKQRLASISDEYPWLGGMGESYAIANKRTEWWTFAGATANASICSGLQEVIASRIKSDDLRIVFPDHCTRFEAEAAIEKVSGLSASGLRPVVDSDAMDGLKFSDILPREFAIRAIQSRLVDYPAVETILRQPVISVATQ